MTAATKGAAVVTSAAQGLGGHLTRRLLEEGYEVVAGFHQNRGDLDRMASEFPRRLHVVQGDLTDGGARQALVDAAAERGGGEVAVLLNVLGLYPEKTLDEIALEEWRMILESTCTTTYDMTHRARLLLARADRARVINIGDSGADRIHARVLATPYHVAKAGVHILTRSYAKLLGPDGTTVNMVSPGFLENSLGQAGVMPLGRVGTCDDVWGAVRYLLSPEADYVSGTNLVVSGAWNV